MFVKLVRFRYVMMCHLTDFFFKARNSVFKVRSFGLSDNE